MTFLNAVFEHFLKSSYKITPNISSTPQKTSLRYVFSANYFNCTQHALLLQLEGKQENVILARTMVLGTQGFF